MNPKVSFCCALCTRRDDPIHDYRTRFYKDFVSSLESQSGSLEICLGLWPCDDISLESAVTIRHKPISGYFNRILGLNSAASAATGDILFFCDVDLIYPDGAVDNILENVKPGQCYFPIWKSLIEDKSKEIWREHSYGVSGFTKTDFESMGGFCEKQGKSWGGDIKAFNKANKHGLKIIRKKWEGLWHQWHPKTSRNFYHEVDDRRYY